MPHLKKKCGDMAKLAGKQSVQGGTVSSSPAMADGLWLLSLRAACCFRLQQARYSRRQQTAKLED